MIVPWTRKFRTDYERDGSRFYIRVMLGVFLFYVARRWEFLPGMHQRYSQIAFGWIPLELEEGAVMPVWTPLHRIYPEVQIRWGHN